MHFWLYNNLSNIFKDVLDLFGPSPPAKKKNLQKSASPANKYTKSIISKKLRIAQKKSFKQQMSARSIPIYPANLATSEKNLYMVAWWQTYKLQNIRYEFHR